MENLIFELKKIDIRAANNIAAFGVIPRMYDQTYSKEILHSKIISDFLNPLSNHNCGNFFILSFLEQIGVQKNIIEPNFTYEVFTEYQIENRRKIDILIVWNENAVIIENKLHNAKDQANQLNDYFSIHRKDEVTEKTNSYYVQKVVYVPGSKIKKAPISELESELEKKLVHFYPSNIISWLSKTPENHEVKEACKQYISLLNYINISNTNIMNAENILNSLCDSDLSELISVSKIINSPIWNTAVLNKLKDAVLNKLKDELHCIDRNVQFNIIQNRYAEIFYKNWIFWIEVYFYSDHFGLWIADKTDSTTINPKITDLGFVHDVNESHHYFKNPDMHNYKFPNNDDFSKLVEHIMILLKKSI
jgi:hypothetical protein